MNGEEKIVRKIVIFSWYYVYTNFACYSSVQLECLECGGCEECGPDYVGVKLIIRSLDDIDTEKQNCFADIWMGAYTCADGSATNAFQATYSGDHKREVFSVSEQRPCWHMCLLNSSEQTFVYASRNLPTLRNFDDGTYYERQHVQCRLSQQMHLHAFPFDSQVLCIRLSLDVSSRNAVFDESKIDVDVDTSFLFVQKAEWEFDINSMYFVMEQQEFGERRDQYPRFSLYIPIKRNPKIYILNIILPLFIVTVSTYFAFDMPQVNVGERLCYLSTLMLTVFALKWSCFEKLPKISYFCFLDWLLATSYLYVFACMAVCVSGHGSNVKRSMTLYYALCIAVLSMLLTYFQHIEKDKAGNPNVAQRRYIRRNGQ